MTTAKQGDTVKVHYTGKLEDGTVFDSSEGRPPLEFTVGDGRIIPGFEEAVVGLSEGDSVTTTIPADKAYGPHHAEMVLTVEKDQFPPNIDPSVGDQLQLQQQDGRQIQVLVTEVTSESVTLDANHPLAGKDLTFNIELVAVEE